MLVFSGFIYINQLRDIRGDALYHLERKLSDISELLLGYPKLSPILQPADIFILFDENGKVLVNQGGLSGDDVTKLMDHARMEYVQGISDDISVWWIQEHQTHKEQYFFISKVIFFSGQKEYAILGSPFDPYGLRGRLIFTLLVGNILMIIIALVGGWWLADRAMKPVHTITQAALTISETDLNRRLNIPGRDELAGLANTFNGMLARLQSAFERQRQFVADVSHELRTPLTIVNLEAGRALASERSASEYQRAMSVILSENEIMSRLVGDLLTLARMDSGQLLMKKEPLDLSDIALEAVERLVSLAERNKVRLYTGDLPEVIIFGDRKYLHQMVSNLIENGIKYSGGADKWVRVETGFVENIIFLRVIDNGPGISPESLPHLFERFYRVDEVRSGEGGAELPSGTGLGLSIVDWIVKAHHGQVNVESARDGGTIFEVRFGVPV